MDKSLDELISEHAPTINKDDLKERLASEGANLLSSIIDRTCKQHNNKDLHNIYRTLEIEHPKLLDLLELLAAKEHLEVLIRDTKTELKNSP